MGEWFRLAGKADGGCLCYAGFLMNVVDHCVVVNERKSLIINSAQIFAMRMTAVLIRQLEVYNVEGLKIGEINIFFPGRDERKCTDCGTSGGDLRLYLENY